MTSIDDLHTEAKIMTVREHLDMICSQFLTICLQRDHPSFPVFTADSGPREKKLRLQRLFNAVVAPHTAQDGTIANAEAVRKEIHTAAVRDAIEARGSNRVLGEPAPETHEEEKLPRGTRRVLSQLRVGVCHALNDFKHRVGQSETDICPCCEDGDVQEVQTVQHIFECTAHPTDLEPIDLWRRPIAVA